MNWQWIGECNAEIYESVDEQVDWLWNKPDTHKDRVQVCCKSTMYKISCVAILFACYDQKQKTRHRTAIGSEASGWSVPPLVLHALAPASESSRPPTNVFLLLDRQRTAPAPAHLWSVCVVLCSQCLFAWGLCGSQSGFFCVSLGTRPHIAAFLILIHIKVMNKKWMFIKIHTCKP